MYCKFCGNRISSNANKCTSCGSAINLYDGGQSFFEDNELDAWQTDNVVHGNSTGTPKTQIIHPDSGTAAKATAYTPKIERASGKASRKNKKKSKGFLSSPTRLIVFCIVSALVLVLLVVGVVSVIDKNPDDNKCSYCGKSGCTEHPRCSECGSSAHTTENCPLSSPAKPAPQPETKPEPAPQNPKEPIICGICEQRDAHTTQDCPNSSSANKPAPQPEPKSDPVPEQTDAACPVCGSAEHNVEYHQQGNEQQ